MKKKHILITGASRGLGATLACTWSQYLGDKLKLSLVARDGQQLEIVKASCKALGSEVDVYSQDLLSLEQSNNLFENIENQTPIDIAVFNAGITANTRNGVESSEQLARIIDTNLRSTMVLANRLANTMATRGQGSIVFINSIAAFRGLALTPGYCASKAGLKAYADALRGKLEPEGVHVLSVYPGFLDTDMTDQYPGPKPFKKTSQTMATKIIKAADKKRAVLIYPWILGFGQQLLNLLPARWADRCLRLIGYG